MLTVQLARALEPRGIVVLALHPGWVRTDMGGERAPIAPQDSVAGMRCVVAALGAADRGGFFHHDGTRPAGW